MAGLAVQQRRPDHRRRGHLEVDAGQLGHEVLVGDDLALLGDLDLPVEGAEGLGQDRPAVGPPPRPTVPPRPWNRRRCTPWRGGDVPQCPLGPVDLPRRGRDAAELVGVGVAEHHLLRVAPQLHQPPVGGGRQRFVEQRPRPGAARRWSRTAARTRCGPRRRGRRPAPPPGPARPGRGDRRRPGTSTRCSSPPPRRRSGRAPFAGPGRCRWSGRRRRRAPPAGLVSGRRPSSSAARRAVRAGRSSRSYSSPRRS